MDRFDPDQPPSIFSRPELVDEPHRPEHEPERPGQSVAHRPGTRAPTPPTRSTRTGPGRRAMVAMGAGGLLILIVAGFVAASLLGPPAAEVGLSTASVSPSPSVSATASASQPATPSAPVPTAATPSATATAAASPTPVPTPAGPPQEIAVGGWATVSVGELNVRREAGLTSTSLYRLVRGAVAHVFEGPVSRDGLNWYRVASLGGAQGWAASGPQADPFLTTFVEDSDLLYCDRVTSDVLQLVDGSVEPHDPIMVGELALPAAAFDDLELGVLELARATRSNACFGAEIGPGGIPVMYTQTRINACGRVTGDGAAFRLRPAAGMNVAIEYQVKETAIVHPGLMATDGNVGARVRLAALGDAVTLCVFAGVTETATGVGSDLFVDGTQCVVVEEHAANQLTIRAAEGGEAVQFAIAPDQPIEAGSISVGVPTGLTIGASVGGGQHSFWVYETPITGCG